MRPFTLFSRQRIEFSVHRSADSNFMKIALEYFSFDPHCAQVSDFVQRFAAHDLLPAENTLLDHDTVDR